MKPIRRLVAVMFTDIQGYTKLMQKSEEAAVMVRSRHRNIFEPTTHKYEGEIIQYYGDGTLSIFDSTVKAMQCAAEMQKKFRQHPAIPVRIGIHTGDVLISEEDIIGDTVNLAARVESMGVAGSVMVTGKVADEIANQPRLPLVKMGEFHFKNDRQKRKVYALDLPGLVVPAKKDMQGKLEKKKALPWGWMTALATVILAGMAFAFWPLSPSPGSGQIPDRKIEALAILPFTNRTHKAENDYLVEGIHEAIIDQCNKIGVKVKPRTSMMAYQDSPKSIKEIAEELQVQGLVEGSVLRTGEALEVQIRLIDGKQETYLWAGEYKAPYADVFRLYKEVTTGIAEEIELVLSPQMQDELLSYKNINVAAYDAYLKGRYQANRGVAEASFKAIDFYKKSVRLDPQFGPAYRGLVESYLLLGFGNLPPKDAHTQFRIYAQKALELDPDIGKSHQLLAMIKIFSESDWEGAEVELKKALEVEAKSPVAWDTYMQFLWALGRMDEAVKAGEQAIALGPRNHFAHCNLAWAYFANHEYEKSLDMVEITNQKFGNECHYHNSLPFRVMISRETPRDTLLAQLVNIQAQMDSAADREQHIKYMGLLALLQAKLGHRQEALALVKQLEGEAEAYYIDPYNFVFVYLFLGKYERAMDLVEQAARDNSFLLIYTIKMDPAYEVLYDHPRYRRLLKQLNLPPPAAS
ncbi:MAG: adenylate/guanylate cyclase domain-containing protein [Bacteroidota bacterium]